MPLISVIMPVYNVERYIKNSIQSVMSQTLVDFELLVVDDGSSDNSMEFVSEFKDDRIKVFRKDNGGLSDARNFGLKKAKGKYVYFIDSDDWIEPDLLNTCFSLLEERQLDFLVFGYFLDKIDKQEELTHSIQVFPAPMLYQKSKGSLKLSKQLLGLLGYAWNKMYSKKFLDSNNIVFEKGVSLVEDILFNAKVLANTDEILCLDRCYYHYSDRPVETLVKKSYQDPFKLKLQKNNALREFMNAWAVDEENQKEILAYSIVQGIRYCLHNLFAYKNDLSLIQKSVYVKYMVNDEETLSLIDFFKSTSAKDRLFEYLINRRMFRTLSLIMFISKIETYNNQIIR